MKVRDLLNLEIDMDVYDNVCEELAIAFCAPVTLTDAGREHFKDALDLEVESIRDGYIIIDVDDPDEKEWNRKLNCAKEFFESMAGLCSAEDFDKWVVTEN